MMTWGVWDPDVEQPKQQDDGVMLGYVGFTSLVEIQLTEFLEISNDFNENSKLVWIFM